MENLSIDDAAKEILSGRQKFLPHIIARNMMRAQIPAEESLNTPSSKVSTAGSSREVPTADSFKEKPPGRMEFPAKAPASPSAVETMALADTEDNDLAPNPSKEKTAEPLIALRVSCIRLLTLAIGFPKIAGQQQTQSRSQIIMSFSESLYSNYLEVIDTLQDNDGGQGKRDSHQHLIGLIYDEMWRLIPDHAVFTEFGPAHLTSTSSSIRSHQSIRPLTNHNPTATEKGKIAFDAGGHSIITLPASCPRQCPNQTQQLLAPALSRVQTTCKHPQLGKDRVKLIDPTIDALNREIHTQTEDTDSR